MGEHGNGIGCRRWEKLSHREHFVADRLHCSQFFFPLSRFFSEINGFLTRRLRHMWSLFGQETYFDLGCFYSTAAFCLLNHIKYVNGTSLYRCNRLLCLSSVWLPLTVLDLLLFLINPPFTSPQKKKDLWAFNMERMNVPNVLVWVWILFDWNKVACTWFNLLKGVSVQILP